MKLVLVEYVWHAEEIKKNIKFFKNDIIVSLDAEVSYILKKNNVKFYETYNFCDHKELWKKYKDITEHSIKISQVLDEALWQTDQRFKNLKWNFFNDYHYIIKISFDQLFFYSELISILLDQYNFQEITVAETSKITIDNNTFLINSNSSVLEYLLETKLHSNKVKINKVVPNNDYRSLNFFSNKNIFIFKKFIKTKVKNTYEKLNFLFNYYTLKPKYLSINCFEISRYKKMYPDQSKLFLSFNSANGNKKKTTGDRTFFNKFIKYLENETDFYNMTSHNNVSFKLIFNEILFKLTQELDFALIQHYKAKKVIKKTNPNCVIFQNMSPFNTDNVVFRKICNDLGIPFVTWTHGGTGLNYSISPFDITDFRFCKNHISYGLNLKDLIVDDKCVLKELGFNVNQKIYPVGSCRLDYDNRKKTPKKIIEANNKKTILFIMGFDAYRNQFYFGRNREKMDTLLWEFNYNIISLLKRYQKKYNIIFKDYPYGRESLWKRMLKDNDANEILFFSREYTVNDLLRISDLNILPWISTTFFEALYFDSDIFLMDQDVRETYQNTNIKDEIYYFSKTKSFLINLEKYLENGKFYTRSKTKSRNYYIKLDGMHKRDKFLNESLSQINKL